ncbi:hypothetical protein COLO4_13249 [Corchorus olitorius]|uniref:Uncharacterized protein n=1 Tax=Corchorus olitorius TaxID=93759 RepID=A0A1R3JXC5_9ROSI|nr:hypothetical protein COLO4_13249 [Corchorus olitorius]
MKMRVCERNPRETPRIRWKANQICLLVQVVGRKGSGFQGIGRWISPVELAKGTNFDHLDMN